MLNSIILLAAGNSRRFGSNKLLYEIEGKPMYRHGFDLLADIVRKNINYSLTVITQYDTIADYVNDLKMDRIKAVINPDSELGLSYSVKAGIKHAPDADYYTFVVADQPYMSEEMAADFMKKAIESGCLTGCVEYNGKYKNPTVFSQSLIPELMLLEGDKGGKEVLKQHMDSCYGYPIKNASETTDIDFHSSETSNAD